MSSTNHWLGHFSPSAENVPRVRMTEMPYFKMTNDRHMIVKPTVLESSSMGVEQRSYVTVSIPYAIAVLIAQTSYARPLPRQEVLLRCCRLDSSEVQHDEWPDELTVKINMMKVDTLPPVNPPTHAGGIGKRTRQYAIITKAMRNFVTTSGHYIRREPPVLNIGMTWTRDKDSPRFLFHVALVTHVSVKALTYEKAFLATTHTLVTREEIKAHIKALNEDDDVVGTDEVTISLRDPLTMTRMSLPVRGRQCKHFQCFDLEQWLTVNVSRPTCKCPVCDSKISFSTMRREEYFIDMLFKCPPTVTSVKLYARGNWIAFDDTGNVVCESDRGSAAALVVQDKRKSVLGTITLDDAIASVSTLTIDLTSPTKKTKSGDNSVIVLDDDDIPDLPQPSPPSTDVATLSKHGNCFMYTITTSPSSPEIKRELDSIDFLRMPIVMDIIERTPPSMRYKVLSSLAEVLVTVDKMATRAGMSMSDARKKAMLVWPSHDNPTVDPDYPNLLSRGQSFSESMESFTAFVNCESAVNLFVSAANQTIDDDHARLTVVLAVESPEKTGYVYTTTNVSDEPDSQACFSVRTFSRTQVIDCIKTRIDDYLERQIGDCARRKSPVVPQNVVSNENAFMTRDEKQEHMDVSELSGRRSGTLGESNEAMQ